VNIWRGYLSTTGTTSGIRGFKMMCPLAPQQCIAALLDIFGPDPDPDRIWPSKTVKKYTRKSKQSTKSKYGFYTIQNN
jgi:hypothetical protein